VSRPAFDPSTDYYSILGVTSGATRRDILGAYRKLAKVHHPDLHAGSTQAEARMARINRAKTILADPGQRAAYDAARRERYGAGPGVVSAAAAVRPQPVPRVGRVAPPSAEPTTGRPSTAFPWPLLLLAIPLLLVVTYYLVDGVQVATRPLPPRNMDLALAPISRPDVQAVARSALTLIGTQPPSRRIGDYVFSQTQALMDISPEASFLKAAGRKLAVAGRDGDAALWAQGVAELCALAGNC
jgi:hypothetical protein